MMQTPSPGDRATTFQAVQGEPEHYSGEVLLVTAYALLWALVLAWVAYIFRRQSALGAKVADLERALAAAAKDAKAASQTREATGAPRS